MSFRSVPPRFIESRWLLLNFRLLNIVCEVLFHPLLDSETTSSSQSHHQPWFSTGNGTAASAPTLSSWAWTTAKTIPSPRCDDRRCRLDNIPAGVALGLHEDPDLCLNCPISLLAADYQSFSNMLLVKCIFKKTTFIASVTQGSDARIYSSKPRSLNWGTEAKKLCLSPDQIGD